MSDHAAVTQDTWPASRQRAIGVMLLISASVLWSLSGVAVKIVKIEPLTFVLWRSLAAGIAIAPLLPLSRGVWPRPRWMLLSILIYTAVVSLLVTAMTRATAAEGIFLQYTGPVFCALLAWLLQRRHIRWQTWLAIAIATIGVVTMLVGGERPAGLIGPAAGLGSGIAFGALILTLERLERPSHGQVNTFAIVAFNNLGCAAILALLAMVLGQSLAIQPWQLAVVVALGVVQIGVPYVLFQFGLRRVSAVDASLLILLEPVLNPIWVWLAVGEQPDVATFIGGATILVAMAIEAFSSPSR